MRLNNSICLTITLTLLVILVLGCGGQSSPKKEQVVARVDSYVITVQDLQEEIEHSPYSAGSAKDLEQLLDLALRREVLIQEAQRRGLDRNKDFMKAIERYWKQTLVKELLQDETSKIYTSGSSEADRELILNKWMEELIQKAKIKVHRDALQKIKLNKE